MLESLGEKLTMKLCVVQPRSNKTEWN